MKRKIITLVLAMAASSIFSASVMAEDAKINGFYDIGTEENVAIVPYAGETAVTVAEKNIDDDTDMEAVYVDSDRLDVTFSAATADDHYGIILVEGTEIPTKDTPIYYINQDTAGSESINFNVYPKTPEATVLLTLYISSSDENFELLSIPVNYAVDATEVEEEEPSYTLGDVNSDNKVDAKDVILVRRHLAGGYGVTIVEVAANVNGDAKLDVKDVVTLRRFIAGGYGVELK